MLALLLVAPLLGLDNFAAAASISVARSDWRTCLRVCAVFGAYALVAPLIGLQLGQVFATSIGDSGRILGGVVILLIGLRGLLSGTATTLAGTAAATGPIGSALPANRTAARYDLRSILLIGISVSTDTLAAGFGLGLYGIPTAAAVAIMAAATVIMSFIGFSLGGAIAGRLNHRADQLSSAALALIGLALLSHLS